jgi:hypothetical protein
MTYTGNGLSVCVPYRPDPQPELDLPAGHRLVTEGVPRDVIWRWLQRRYATLLPDAEIVVGDSGPGPFNRAVARNRAVENSTRPLILLADADVCFDVDQIESGVNQIGRPREGITDAAEWVLCFTRYVQLLPETTAQLISRQTPAEEVAIPERVGWTTNTGVEGLVLVTREAFDRVRGFDERMSAWGLEGWAFARALETLCHGGVRTEGTAIHLHHPRDPRRKNGIRVNQKFYDEYLAASDDPEAMAKVVADR